MTFFFLTSSFTLLKRPWKETLRETDFFNKFTNSMFHSFLQFSNLSSTSVLLLPQWVLCRRLLLDIIIPAISFSVPTLAATSWNALRYLTDFSVSDSLETTFLVGGGGLDSWIKSFAQESFNSLCSVLFLNE